MSFVHIDNDAAKGTLEFFVNGNEATPYAYYIHIKFLAERDGSGLFNPHCYFAPDRRETLQVKVTRDRWEINKNLSMFIGSRSSIQISSR